MRGGAVISRLKDWESGRREIRVCEDAEECAFEAAAFFASQAEEAIRERGAFMALLSGGQTPSRTYETLARFPIDWSRVHLFWSDERNVPPDHEDSNYRLVNEKLLSRIAIPEENVHRIRTELGDPHRAALESIREMRLFFQDGAPYPRFDLAFLGLGADGHTASLFPGSQEELASPSWVIAPYVSKLGKFRISVSLGVLNAARAVLFLVTGQGKAEIVEQVLDSRTEHRALLPAQRVDPREGRTLWILDRAAASLLKT